MTPVIAVVGRPNVGKSTLFNALTNTRDALVADLPGLTRDRQYGEVELADFQATLVDTSSADRTLGLAIQQKQDFVNLTQSYNSIMNKLSSMLPW